MNLTIGVVGLFGIINIVGGLVGYFKTKSIISLISGSLSGVILLICAYGISERSSIAAIISIIIAVLLGGRFILTIIKKI